MLLISEPNIMIFCSEVAMNFPDDVCTGLPHDTIT